jgi:hypothetical protein
VAVHPGPQERHEIGPIAGGERPQSGGELQLGLGVGQLEGAGPEGLGDVGEQGLDAVEPERIEHPAAVGVGMGSVRHGAISRRR